MHSSSASSRSAFSVLSEGCVSEAGSSTQRNRNSAEESQEECPKCAALEKNSIFAGQALASLSEQHRNLQKELKKTEQVTKINEEQAKYIDERRSKLEKLEAEHMSLYVDFENLRIRYDSLQRQYDELVASGRKNQRLVEESVKYRETCKKAVEDLVAEKKGRQELLAKYLKSVDAAVKLNDSLKQAEKKCVQLQAANEKLEPLRNHCPAIFRLLLQLGEIVENNGLMSKSLRKRLEKYKESEDLRNYLLMKSRRVGSLSESSTKSLEESSDDDELAKGVEDLLQTIGNSPRLTSPEKALPRKETESDVEGRSKLQLTKPAKQTLKTDAEKVPQSLMKMQPERVKVPEIISTVEKHKSGVYEKKAKTLCERQREIIEKRKQVVEKALEDKKAVLGTSSNVLASSTSTPFAAQETTRSTEERYTCRCDEQLSKWLCFAQLDPLLPELSRPTFLSPEWNETFNQCTTSDYMDCVFGGPLSPSISSRRTSVSSAEGFGSSSGQQGKSSSLVCAAVEATEDAQHFDMSLSPSFIPGSPTHRVTDTLAASGTPNLVHLGTSLVASAIVELDDQARLSKDVPSIVQTTSDAISVLKDYARQSGKQPGEGAEAEQSHEVPVESKETIPLDQKKETSGGTSGSAMSVRQSKCSMTLRPRIKRGRFWSETDDDGSRLQRSVHSKSAEPFWQRHGKTNSSKEDAEEVQGIIKHPVPESRLIVTGRAAVDKNFGEKLIRLSANRVANVLQMMMDKAVELAVTRREKVSERCVETPARQWKRVRVESWSSDDDNSIDVDAPGSGNDQQSRVPETGTLESEITKSESAENSSSQILSVDRNEDEMSTSVVVEDANLNSDIPLERSCRTWTSSESSAQVPSNLEKTLNTEEPEILLSDNKRGKAYSPRISKEGQSPGFIKTELKSKAASTESTPNSTESKGLKKLTLTRTSQSSELKKSQTRINQPKDLKKSAGMRISQTASSEPEESSKPRVQDEEEQKDGYDHITSKSAPSDITTSSLYLSDSDDDGRLQIVTDETASPSVSSVQESGHVIPNESDVPKDSETLRKNLKTVTKVFQKPTKTMKSEMYIKMHKRLAQQTSCMKGLGRLQKRKAVDTQESPRVAIEQPKLQLREMRENDRIANELPKSERKEINGTKAASRVASQKVDTKKMGRSSITQRKRGTIVELIPAESVKRIKIMAASLSARQAKMRTSLSKAPVASDEAAVMSLFDQALAENIHDEKLLEIVQKFQSPAISVIPCEKLAECCVKFINKLDVGNMWHSVVLAVRYWSDKQNGQNSSKKVLELHQVASAKERGFIEVLHQLSGEERWKDIVFFFLTKMIATVMKTCLVSVAQHGRNIRCILICARILMQDSSSDELLKSVSDVLRRLIERDVPEKVVPMMCYAVTIVPEIVDELLFEENEQNESLRRVMALHLASRDELYTIFSKVVLSSLTVDIQNATCFRKLNYGAFHSWFTEAVNAVIMDYNGLDVESKELSPRLSSAMVTCHAMFSLASNHLIPDKEALAFSMLDECVRSISGHFSASEKETGEMYGDATRAKRLSWDEVIKTSVWLLLLGRLITSLNRSKESCMLPQISKLIEEIHRIRKILKRKIEQGEQTAENRLWYFGLNDSLRLMKPSTKYLPSAFT